MERLYHRDQAERRHRIGARRGLVTPGRHHPGTAGEADPDPTRAMCRDRPPGRNEFDRRRSCRLRKRFSPQNDLHQKTNFCCAINSILPVQMSAEKYSALAFPQISRIFLASRLVQRGVSRSSRTWRRGAVAARGRSILLRVPTNDRFADGQAVWS
jgi:hypothetical protein